MSQLTSQELHDEMVYGWVQDRVGHDKRFPNCLKKHEWGCELCGAIPMTVNCNNANCDEGNNYAESIN